MRCVRDGVKFIRGVKALQRYADRAPRKNFFCKVEEIYGDQIQVARELKAKLDERQRRIDAGEQVSDTSSTRDRKKEAKE